MFKFLKAFMIMISLYFILHTVAVYGLFDGRYQALVSGVKDLSWILFGALVLLRHPRLTWSYIRKTRPLIGILIVMAIIGVVVTLYADGLTMAALKNMIIGLKYGRYFMLVFWMAGMIGYIMATMPRCHDATMPEDKSTEAPKHRSIEAFIRFIVRLSWFILLGGLVVQGSKVLFPDLWYALGFGPLNVYKAGVAPPLYYLTKQDGVMRYSGLFSGPNNFAFRLIAVTPLLWHSAGILKQTALKRGARVGLIVFGALNLGRVLLLGWIAEIVPSFAHNKRIKNNKFIVGLGIGLIIGLFGYITYMKRESTTEHFALGIDALYKFFARPWGYGLGSSGPGVHRNGSLLPENYYLQLALDYGWLGPICFILFWRKVATMPRCHDATMPHEKSTAAPQHRSIEAWNRLFITGFLGMLIAGGFLHVFEDSMVNYLFFVPRGVVFGSKLGITEFGILNSGKRDLLAADKIIPNS